MLPDTLQSPTQPHALPFTDGEVVLWTERRRRIVDGNVLMLLIFSIVLLIIYGLLIWESEVPGKLQQDTDTYLQAAKLWLFVPGLSVCCLLLAAGIGIHHHCTTYVLTNRRGIVVTTPPLFRRQAHAAALAPGMVRELKRHRDGTASYMITEQRVGHMRLAVGFEYVHQVGELEALLARYGVKLPAAQSVADRPPTKKFLLQLLVVPVVILCVVCNRAMTEPDFFLFLQGEQATATIVAYQPRIHREGSRARRTVTYYHPVLQFCTGDGTPIQTTDCTGDACPTSTRPGERVRILYDPQRPGIARRATSYPYLSPGITLLVFLSFLGAFVYNLHRLIRYRKPHPQP